MSSVPIFTCCNKQFKLKDSYQKHRRRSHKEYEREKSVSCNVDDCHDKFWTVNELRLHMNDEHGVRMEMFHQFFSTKMEFETWLKEYEQDTNQRFVKPTGIKPGKGIDEISRRTYNCRSTGFEERKVFEELDHARNAKGSCRMNGHCTAKMVLIETRTGYELFFYKTHNHPIQVKNCNLSQKTIETIAAMLRARFETSFVLDFFRAKPKEHRDHWVTLKDIKAIRDRFNLTDDGREHKDDAKSVHIFAHLHENLVIFYRPASVGVDGKEKEPIICIQTERQREYLRNHKNLPVVCVDSTHNIGPKMKMATLMTVDENIQGYTLAFCFCKSEDTLSMQIFFGAIRDAIGRKIEAEYFVSDDADAFYNAWCAEMCESKRPHKRLCAWHVNRNWIGNMNRIKNPVIKKKTEKKDSSVNQQLDLPEEQPSPIVKESSLVQNMPGDEQMDSLDT